MHSFDPHLIASLVAGALVLPGLLLGRWQRMPAVLQTALAPLAAGILVWLMIDLGGRSLETVVVAFKAGSAHSGLISLSLVLLGLGVGRFVLGGRPAARTGHGDDPAADLALITALGIGVQNLGRGMALGQGGAGGAVEVGAALAAVGAFANVAGGVAIAGSLRGETARWSRLGLLALVSGAPAVLGTLAGGVGARGPLGLLCSALAMGVLLTAVQRLLQLTAELAPLRSLAALAVGVLLGPALVSPAMKTVVGAVLAGPVTVAASDKRVEVKIAGGRFVPATLAIPAGAALIVKNEDAKTYTLEGAGILYGDVPIEPNSTRTVTPMGEPGAYTIIVEEVPHMGLPVRVSGGSTQPAVEMDTVARAFALDRQPVVFSDAHGPDYAAFTRFNLTVRGEQARDEVIDRLCEIQRTVSSTWLPVELEQYFTQSSWVRLRPSVALVIGLGPTAYDAARFGKKVAASRPGDLHPISYSAVLGFDAAKSQRDMLVRVTSDSMWFNQQVCRYIWRQLAGRISDYTMDCGYANPNGRSPILGGFFDGTGNPIGEERDKAVFLTGAQRGGTYLAWFRIRFDQERFESHTLAEQQVIIGRVHKSGRQLPNDKASSHRAKAEGDGSNTILRQGVVYDEGPGQTGLIFASVQASLTDQFEGILRGFMMNRGAPSAGTGPDRLLEYMHFEEGGYYFVPPAEEED